MEPVFRIRICVNADPDPPFYDEADPDPDPGFETKNWQKFTAWKKIKNFDQKMQFTYLKAIMDVQATGEAFSPQKRIPSASNH